MSARKSPSERSNREKPVYSDMAITWDGKIRGYPLPSGFDWCERTRIWWETIRRSAQAMSFHETDWLFLQETAFLHNKLWGVNTKFTKEGDVVRVPCSPTEAVSLAGEIRRRTESYGFTWADRRKYGITITTPEEATQEAEQIAKSAVNYRAKLDGLA